MIYNSTAIAEICGIHSGDGYLRNDGKRVELDISGSLEEKIYYDTHVIPLFSRFFEIRIKGKYFYSRKTYGFVIRDKSIVERFHQIGFPYRAKGLSLKIPEFVIKSNINRVKASFLRGFLDTDGCITFDRRYSTGYADFKRKFHTYPRLILSTTSENLSKGVQKLLKDLRLKYWVQIYEPYSPKEKIKYIIWVRGKEFGKWMDIIGSNNPVKYSRYRIWKKYGFCPPNTTYKQRIKIINDKLDPKSLYWARSSIG